MASLVLNIDVKDDGTTKVKAFQETVVRAGTAMKNAGGHANAHGRELDRLGGYVDRTSARIMSMIAGYVAAGAATVAAAVSVRRVITETIEADRVSAQLEARLRSTGGAVGYTHAELTKMASGLQAVTTYGDEAIITAETLLLQFRQIGHDVFPDALKATLDIATAMNSDLPSAARTLGKALNDPVGGLTALRRAGLQFTEGQRDQIKYFAETNRMADAQRLILGELEKQIGGAAIAARGTLGGALEGLKNSFGDLFEAGNTQDAVASINALNDSLQTESVQHYAKVFRDSIMDIIASAQYIGPALDQIEIEWSEFWLKLSIWAENYKNQIINSQEDLGRDLKRTWADLKSTDLFSVNNLFGSDPLGGKIPMFAPETSADVWARAEAEKNARAAASAERIKQMTKEADQAVVEAMERRGASLAKIHAAARATGNQIAGLNGVMGDGAQDVAGYDNELSKLADTLLGLQNAASIMRELDQLRVQAGEMSDTQAKASDLAMQRQILEASMAKAQHEADAATEARDRAQAEQEVLNLSKQIMALPEVQRLNEKIQAHRNLIDQMKAENSLAEAQAQSSAELARQRIEVLRSSAPEYQSPSGLAGIHDAQLAAIRDEYASEERLNALRERQLGTQLDQTANESDRLQIQKELNELLIKSDTLGTRMANSILIEQNNALREQKRLREEITQRDQDVQMRMRTDQLSGYSSDLSGYEGIGDGFTGGMADSISAYSAYASQIMDLDRTILAAREEMESADADRRIALNERITNALSMKDEASSRMRLSIASNMFGGMADTMLQFYEQSGRENESYFKAWKAMAIVETMINTYAAAMAAYKAMAAIPVVGPALGIAAASATVAFGTAQVSAIQSQQPQKMHSGGRVRKTSYDLRDDEVVRTLQVGEGVLSRREMAALERSGSNGSSSGSSSSTSEIHIYQPDRHRHGLGANGRRRGQDNHHEPHRRRLRRKRADPAYNQEQLTKFMERILA